MPVPPLVRVSIARESQSRAPLVSVALNGPVALERHPGEHAKYRHPRSQSSIPWGERFPVITQAWLNACEYVIPFLAFPPEVRRVIYTTNAIEAVNRQLRKAIKTKGHFPNEDAARKHPSLDSPQPIL